ncbi:craniofacial development-like protein [Wolffia australiana]
MTSNVPNNHGISKVASNGNSEEVEEVKSLREQQEEKERLARVNAAWELMNSGLPSSKAPAKLTVKPSPRGKKAANKSTPEWMVALGLAPKKNSTQKEDRGKTASDVIRVDSEEAKKLAAAALSAVRDISSAATSSAVKGRVEITEVRDFAGEEVEVKKLVEADSREAMADKARTGAGALDSVLEQIKKKQKLSVLDKTKKDWGEFKEENKGLEDELDAYKKSSNQYLDKVSFLQRSDLREFERERDARLATQAKRRPESMREDDDA